MASLARLRHGPIVARHLSTLSSRRILLNQNLASVNPLQIVVPASGRKPRQPSALLLGVAQHVCLSECGGNALVFTVGVVV